MEKWSLDELVAIALFWPILTPTRRVGVNSIFVAVIDTNELVAIDTAYGKLREAVDYVTCSRRYNLLAALSHCCLNRHNLNVFLVTKMAANLHDYFTYLTR